jgi:hypothetical protein
MRLASWRRRSWWCRPARACSSSITTRNDCTEINQVGLLSPGASRETGNLVTARTCGFHDHDDFANANLQGHIIIR